MEVIARDQRHIAQGLPCGADIHVIRVEFLGLQIARILDRCVGQHVGVIVTINFVVILPAEVQLGEWIPVGAEGVFLADLIKILIEINRIKNRR